MKLLFCRGRWPVAVVALCVALAGHAAAQTYSIQDLGTLGGPTSMAYGINNAGQVAGVTCWANFRETAFLWTVNGMSALNMPYSRFGVARAISNVGHVAGYMDVANGRQHAFLWTSNGLTDLGTLGGNNSFAYGVNVNGQVVGVSDTASGESHAFLWSNGAMQDLGTLGGSTSVAYGINASGQVVGFSQLAGEPWYREHAFLWSSGIMQDLGTPAAGAHPDGDSCAVAINDAGTIVGNAGVPRTNDGGLEEDCPVKWTNGALQPFVMGIRGIAYAISGSGLIVGQVIGRPVLFDPSGGYRELSTALEGVQISGWELTAAYGVNDAGQIVGYGKHNGAVRAFRLTPLLSSGRGQF